MIFLRISVILLLISFSSVSWAFDLCSDTSSSDDTGVLNDSGGTGGAYQNFEDCQFLIAPSGATSINLDFTVFSVESGFDFVRIYDGSTTSSPLLATLSGTTIPATISSTSGTMLVRFTSDFSVTQDGFEASWTTGAVVGSCETFADNFSSVSYSNQDGSVNWASDWVESNDDNNSSSGDIQISGNRLRIKDGNRVIARAADLSAFSSASLTFDYRENGYDDANDSTDIQVRGGGDDWQTLQSFTGSSVNFGSTDIDIPAGFLASDFELRFITSSTTGNNDNFRVDNLVLEGCSGGGSSDICTVADDFASVSYSQNSGVDSWSGDWIEVGESDGPGAGIARVRADNCSSGNCLRLGVPSGSGAQTYNDIGVRREVDLSGVSAATLDFTYRTGTAQGTTTGRVWASDNGGTTWTQLQSYTFTSTNFTGTPQTFDISAYASTNTQIRFTADGVSATSGFYVDDIEITYPCNTTTADHLAIEHSGSAVNCEPAAITLSAHTDDDPHVVDISYTGTVTLSTSTGNGDWSYVSGGDASRLTNTGSGNATYVFDGSENGTVELGLFNPVAETININASDGNISEQSGSADAAEDDEDLVFSAAGFIFSSINNQIAGKPSEVIDLRAINTNTTTGECEALLTGDVTIQMSLNHSNPSSGSRPVYVQDSSVNFIAVTTSTDVDLDFGSDTDDTATFIINYPDAGQIYLTASATVSGVTLQNNSDLFISRPFGFDISVTDNPAANDSSGDRFRSAGENFTVVASGVLWQQADDVNNDGAPDGHNDSNPADRADLSNNTVTPGATSYSGTPNFTAELNPETLRLSSYLEQPGAGNDPGIAGSLTMAGTGSGNLESTDIVFNEVGIIEVIAEITDSEYLSIGSVETALMRSVSGRVGRFTPSEFIIDTANNENGAFLNANTSAPLDFTYIGQSFGYASSNKPTVRVIARGTASSDPLLNYVEADGWARLNQVSYNSPATDQTKTGLDGVTLMAVTTTSDSANSVFSEVSGGVFDMEVGNDSFIYVKDNNSETTNFDSDIDVNITRIADADNREFSGSFTLTPDPIDIRFGRIALMNAHGSELSDLRVGMYVEYLDAISGFYILNEDDEDSIINTVNLSIDNNLSSGSTTIEVINPVSDLGDYGVNLTAPGAGADGYIDITPNLSDTGTNPASLPWLQYDWDGDGNHDDNPTGRATFGIYEGNPVNIYIQQIYQ